jgi:hypothetical protein
MSVDMYGTKPTAPAGKHFGGAYCDWTLLGLLVLGLCDKARTSPCGEWFSDRAMVLAPKASRWPPICKLIQ